MEDTHGVMLQFSLLILLLRVLILIIMEDTHGELTDQISKMEKILSLNPYYNGRYSWRVKTHISLRTK